MKVVCHADPHVLEGELVRRIGRAKRTEPLAAVLVLAPTRRLADRVQTRLSGERKAWLSVEVLTFQSVARMILESARQTVPRILSRRVLESVLEDVLLSPEMRDGRLAMFTGKRPGAVRALLNTVDELREAGIDPSSIGKAGAGLELAAAYALYTESLDRLLERRRLTDRAGFLGAAVPLAAPFAARFNDIFLHGAYELTGLHLDLLRMLDTRERVTVLLPASPDNEAPASSFAHNFAGRHLLAAGAAVEPAGDGRDGGLLGDRLDGLYDEAAVFDPVDGDSVEFRNFQGGASEVEWAVRAALKAIAGGVRPSEIAIVARTLEPYAAHLEAAFTEAGIPWTTSARSPLRRKPVVHDLLVLLQVIRDDFPRAATSALLSSPRAIWNRVLGGKAAPSGDLAEAWTRSAGILGGLDEWSTILPDWAARVRWWEDQTDEEKARAETDAAWKRRKACDISGAVRAIAKWRDTARHRWSEHADRIERMVSEFFMTGDGSEDAAIEAVFGIIDEMRVMDGILDSAGVPTEEAYRWFEKGVDETVVDCHGSGNGGISVLDAMQARGLTFRRMFLLGFHGGLFPRVPREDPFLRDNARRRIREITGRQLPVKIEGEDEEHLLLSMMLGSAGEKLHLSWQRADDTGRALAPSLALREIARLVIGKPDFRKIVGEAVKRTPAHPRMRLEMILADTGLLNDEEERLLLALRGEGSVPAVRDRLIDLSPGLESGLAMLAETERFDPASGRFDGHVGEVPGAPATFSVSGFMQLGRCPMQYFFHRVLGIRALDDEISPFGTAPFEFGTAVHAVLEDLYSLLWDGNLPARGDAARAKQMAGEILGEIWEKRTAEIGRRVGTRFGTLWELHAEQWLDSLRNFVDLDLEHLASMDIDHMEFEKTATGSLDLGDGAVVDVTGRFDRVCHSGERIVVSDYKTSGNLVDSCNVTYLLKGAALQVPLYALLASSNSDLPPFDEKVTVELLGVGPVFDPAGDPHEVRPHLEPIADKKRDGMLETLRVLHSLSVRGIFPLLRGYHCSWCSFRPACRRNHAPTLNRHDHYSDTMEFRLLSSKNKSRIPLLADIPGQTDGTRESRKGSSR